MNVELKKNVRVNSPESIFDVMKVILMRENEIERDQEHFWVIGLAPNNTIIYVELVSLGSMDATIVKPMQVFRVGVLKGAVKLVMIHNHPAGPVIIPHDLYPSEEDNDITDRMIQSGRILKIKVIDHLIISPDHFYSYKTSGLLTELEKSKKYVPPYVEEERIRKETLKIGKKQGKKEGRAEGKKIGMEKGLEKGSHQKSKEIAIQLKKDCIPLDVIIRATGLSKIEIDKL